MMREGREQRPLLAADFERLLDRRGGDLARWPTTERAQVERLLASSAEARAALAAAERLDSVLDVVLAAPSVPAGLPARIVARAETRKPAFGWFTASAWRPIGVACAPLLLGFTLGLVVGMEDDAAAADLEDRVLLAFHGTDFADFEVPGSQP